MAIQKTITAVIKTRYDTAANFKAKNPILAAGEKATESDTRKSKTGDGTTEYSALPYDKADTGLTFDPTPTAGSKNPVTSGGVKTALDNKLSLTGGKMNGALNLKNNTWNLAGDDAYFGNNDKGGCLCIKGANNDTGIALVNRNDTTNADCALIRYAGKNITVNKSIDGNITGIANQANMLTTNGDTRDIATVPSDYNCEFIFRGIKNNEIIGLKNTSLYSYLLGLKGWKDDSGGKTHELAFNDNGIFCRTGSNNNWGPWYKILNSSNAITYTIVD